MKFLIKTRYTRLKNIRVETYTYPLMSFDSFAGAHVGGPQPRYQKKPASLGPQGAACLLRISTNSPLMVPRPAR